MFVAFFTNMGERFGFYTMMAILVYFLQAKYGLSADRAGNIYSWFYFAIYALALVGGIVADASKKYKLIIMLGQVVMFAGYVIMAMPGLSLAVTITGLFTIAFGNGLFKGNLQAVVGQLYDDPKYDKVRDNAFLIFYMGINVGAFFAPFAAMGIRSWWLRINGYLHDASLPALCHQYLDGTLQDVGTFQNLADKVNLAGPVTNLQAFAHNYLDVFARGYNNAFAIAAGAMLFSLIIYLIFNKHLPNREKKTGEKTITITEKPAAIPAAVAAGIITAFLISLVRDFATGMAIGLFAGFVTWIFILSKKEERDKIVSLLLVFFVVIFFWMAFHQNGLTLSLFARDYTVKTVGPFTYLFFTLKNILSVLFFLSGLVLLLGKKRTLLMRILGALFTLGGGSFAYYFYTQASPLNPIQPEVFQSFNPLFIVALTFVVIGVFSWLRERDMEPSTPRKIGIGMIIAAMGFVIMVVASLNLISPHDLQVVDASGAVKYKPLPDTSRVSPYWLMSTYLVMTIAELFLSPMGLSFVSKVAPTRFQGVMQGGWLLATAVGNKLLFIGSTLWRKIDLWQLWMIFVVTSLLSAAFIFIIMKKLEKATGNK